jgi:ubiquinol-cytochrome c reductase cytochrome c1 subunit
MKYAKRILATLALLPGLAFANEGGIALDKAPDRSNNMARCSMAPNCSSITA